MEKNGCEVAANAADTAATIELTQALVDGILCKAAVGDGADRLRSAAPEKWAEIAPAATNGAKVGDGRTRSCG
jgi:hypothetical protein